MHRTQQERVASSDSDIAETATSQPTQLARQRQTTTWTQEMKEFVV